MKPFITLLAAGILTTAATAQNRFTPGDQPFIAVAAPVVALTHVRIIDGILG